MMTKESKPPVPPPVQPQSPPSDMATVLDSKALFRNAREVQIMHRGEIYRLQRTRGGKLILVK